MTQMSLFSMPVRDTAPAPVKLTKGALKARMKELRADWRWYQRGGHLPTGFGLCANCVERRQHQISDYCWPYLESRERMAEIEAEAERLGGKVGR